MTIDLNFMAVSKDPAEIPLAFDNRVNEGAYKLSQRVLILLFKDSESALLPELGTDVLLLTTGNVSNVDTLQNQFTMAADQVRETLQQYADVDDPEDEQLDSLDIEVTVDSADPTHVSLLITVKTVSGLAIESVVPYKLYGE